ncbi:MAG: hypothetical protein KGH57_00700 [Candidatus Micrarchaeota archaeon]|nr:hypothetical protein [Candidatus Micrarchaeota archaeon]
MLPECLHGLKVHEVSLQRRLTTLALIFRKIRIKRRYEHSTCPMRMRSQSSIEFLTTYSFLFLILGVAVSVIIFVSGAPSSTIPATCTSSGGPSCNLVQVYTNRSAGYTTVTFSITNSQGVPVNVTNTIVTVRSSTYIGSCTPSLMFPGQSSTCAASVGGFVSQTTLVQGFYLLNAQFCNSGVYNLSNSHCQYELVQYSGSFTAEPSRQRNMLFSFAATQAPQALDLLQFSKISTAPVQPSNFTTLQSGATGPVIYGGTVSYAYATPGTMLGTTYYGVVTQAYPSFLSSLGNPNVACVSPYNSLLSVASTTFYASGTATAHVNLEAGGAMEVFYKVAGIGTVWQNAFFGSAWKSQTPTAYTNTISLSKNLYDIEVWWMNPCGSGGQVAQFTSLPT